MRDSRTQDSVDFSWRAPLTSDAFERLKEGDRLSLVLLEQVVDVGGILFPVTYIHRDLIYRSPGNKDAVAFGQARLNDRGEFEEVRILFSRPHSTATMRGLSLEGQVKEASIE